jgi:hypothetical protein
MQNAKNLLQEAIAANVGKKRIFSAHFLQFQLRVEIPLLPSWITGDDGDDRKEKEEKQEILEVA